MIIKNLITSFSRFIMFFAIIIARYSYAEKDIVNDFANFYDWKQACDDLPKFNKYRENQFYTPLSKDIFIQELSNFSSTMKNQFEQINWVNNIKQTKESSYKFNAYVQKLIIPENAQVAIHGDLHGDINAINNFISYFAKQGFLDEANPFKIKDPNFYIIFLGDYVDRGWYGIEVIYTILRLKNENPNNVLMVRGNHEEVLINRRYGFGSEIFNKFGDLSLNIELNKLYNFLPLAIYLGVKNKKETNFIQCCHGGIEIGFDPKIIFKNKYNNTAIEINELMQEEGFKKLNFKEIENLASYFKNHKKIDCYNGFMWSDFIVEANSVLELSARDSYAGKIFKYGELGTKELLKSWSNKKYKLRSIFRGHQHSDKDMKNRIFNFDQLTHNEDVGIAKLWVNNQIHKDIPSLLENILAVTFSVAPNSGYNWPMHSFGLLEVAQEYNDWRLKNIVI